MNHRVVFGVAAVGGIAAIWAVAAQQPSSAESRLFSVHADQPGVTIVEAMRNGADLPVAGQNGQQTFFRIENPAGAVPCVNAIRFAGSNGKISDTAVDFCANNWDVTIALGGASGTGAAVTTVTPPPAATTAPPATPAPVATSAAPPAAAPTTMPAAPGTIRPVAIATDDSNVTITSAFIGGQAAPIVDRRDPYVQINLTAGAQGIACSLDLGLTLSDGRRIARSVNACASNFVVVVSLVGGVNVPPPPEAFQQAPAAIQSLPPAPPALAQTPPPQQTLPPSAEVADQWSFVGGNPVTLAGATGGAPDFTASCQPASGRATITLGHTADELGPGDRVFVTFTAGAYSKAYPATGSPVGADNLSYPVLTLLAGDPLWASLITERTVTIAIGRAPAYDVSLTGSSTPVKQFLAACSPVVTQPVLTPPPQYLPVPPAATGPATNVLFQCEDGSTLSATFGPASATVYRPDRPPVTLPEVPFNGDGRRFAAGPMQLVGEGEDVYWTRGGGPPLTCHRD